MGTKGLGDWGPRVMASACALGTDKKMLVVNIFINWLNLAVPPIWYRYCRSCGLPLDISNDNYFNFCDFVVASNSEKVLSMLSCPIYVKIWYVPISLVTRKDKSSDVCCAYTLCCMPLKLGKWNRWQLLFSTLYVCPLDMWFVFHHDGDHFILKDERYAKYIGCQAIVPMTYGRHVPIIADKVRAPF